MFQISLSQLTVHAGVGAGKADGQQLKTTRCVMCGRHVMYSGPMMHGGYMPHRSHIVACGHRTHRGIMCSSHVICAGRVMCGGHVTHRVMLKHHKPTHQRRLFLKGFPSSSPRPSLDTEPGFLPLPLYFRAETPATSLIPSTAPPGLLSQQSAGVPTALRLP